jgi:hypothetical protein
MVAALPDGASNAAIGGDYATRPLSMSSALRSLKFYLVCQPEPYTPRTIFFYLTIIRWSGCIDTIVNDTCWQLTCWVAATGTAYYFPVTSLRVTVTIGRNSPN